MTTTTLPFARIVRATERTIHVYDPPTAEGGPTTGWGRAPVGPCVAYARKRVADQQWEVRWVAGNQTWGYSTRLQAEAKLAELTGVAL